MPASADQWRRFVEDGAAAAPMSRYLADVAESACVDRAVRGLLIARALRSDVDAGRRSFQARARLERTLAALP